MTVPDPQSSTPKPRQPTSSRGTGEEQFSETGSSERIEIAHVLFCDIVGYSLHPIDEQKRMMQILQEIVRQTKDYRRAEARQQLVRLPAGDGMALAFLRDAIAPVRCAVEISHQLSRHPEIQVRMGAHSGPVFRSADINQFQNVVGSGINLAQRVMDCGDAGHILVSRNVAEVLNQLSQWQPLLHDLGKHEIRHGVRLHLFNLYTEMAGNPAVPEKLQLPVRQEIKPTKIAPSRLEFPTNQGLNSPVIKSTNFKYLLIVGGLVLSIIASVAFWRWLSVTQPNNPAQVANVLPERNLTYSLTVQKYRNGKPYQEEFQSTGREIFEPGWKFKLNLTSPQEGFLYLLNEGNATSTNNLTLLFPLPSHHNGSAHVNAGERLQTNWYIFDEQPGTETLRLIWSAQPVPEFESLRGLMNPTLQGRIRDPEQIQAVQAFLLIHAKAEAIGEKDSLNKQTKATGHGAVLMTQVELEHH